MEKPKCQWKPKEHGEMKLVKETENFWTFQCGCGCVRAISKPSSRAVGAYASAQRSAKQMKDYQEALARKKAYSLPGGSDARIQ